MKARLGVAAVAAAMMGWVLPAQAAAVATERLPSCSWDRPGHDPFTGDVVAALDRYTDIPRDVRERLQQRMARRQYDDLVSIRRDSIEGRHRYDARIRDMHFGERRVCGEVSRAAWSAQVQERGLVYCDSGQCILVPTVCRNVSRIARRPEGASGVRSAEDESAGAATPLAFDPPAAGTPEVAGDGPSFDEGVHGTPGSAPMAAGPGSASLALAPTASDGGGGRSFETGWAPSGGAVPQGPAKHGETPLPSFPTQPPIEPLPTPTTPVPEPSSWALLAGGLAALLVRQRFAAGRASCSTQKRS
ncbi:MAG TPA: MHFG family PEP-CTERM protein [Burkholderiaceae bacterium]|nr:MHFG family PEP-CTERM protein [Burkholderiaceae bacterium]